MLYEIKKEKQQFQTISQFECLKQNKNKIHKGKKKKVKFISTYNIRIKEYRNKKNE